MTLALNISDLTYCKAEMVSVLAGDFISMKSPVVDAEPGQADGMAIVCDGPGSEDQERLQAFIDVISRWMKENGAQHSLRVYEKTSRGTWRRKKVSGSRKKES
ncbi:MAG: hypothetical protein KatS3mg015_2482 [Fimbriimonadales bacterium]|nr:MAG: hypothetical protein KatS3mg015_2482 [Fimbriimonadales bacterium]